MAQAKVVELTYLQRIMAIIDSMTASADVIAAAPQADVALSKAEAEAIISALTPLDEKFKSLASPTA